MYYFLKERLTNMLINDIIWSINFRNVYVYVEAGLREKAELFTTTVIAISC